jgi:hypothetical protein
MTDRPFTETIELDRGGSLTITRFPDGTGRLAVDKRDVRLSFEVSAADVHRLSESAIAVSLADHLEGFRS